MNSRKFPQKSIGVDIAYYNNGEKQLLLQYPSSEKIIDIVENGVSIPIEEFLTYIFFHRKNPDIPNYRSYKDIEKRICQAFSYLDGYILFDGVSISGPPINPNDSIKSITEHIGEAVGLAIMNRLHGLIEADWIKISSKGGIGASPSFDYQIASTGDQFIQIEAKGSFVINNKLKPSAVSNHKTNIKEKKSKLAELAEENKDPNSSNLRYGIITVIDPNSNRKLKSWLVDVFADSF